MLCKNWQCTNLPVYDNVRYADTYLVGTADASKTSYTIKDGTKYIGSGAFSACTSLSSIVIPEGVVVMQEQAFYNCTKLKTITLPSTLSSVGKDAFEFVYDRSVNIKDLTAWCRIKWETKTSNPLYGRYNKTSYSKLYLNGEIVENLIIPNDVTSIPDYAFDCCASIKTIEVPSTVTEIGKNAFDCCDNLRTLTLSNSVSNIGSYAFSGCQYLYTINSLNTTPPTCDNSFSGISTSCRVFVLQASVDAYKAADYWKNLDVQPIPTYTTSIYNGTNTPVVMDMMLDEIKSYSMTNNTLMFVNGNISETLPANIVKKNSKDEWVADEIVLTDALPLYIPYDFTAKNISYRKNITYTEKQPLYLPFSLRYEDWQDKIKLLSFHNIHEYDNDEDGWGEELVLEFLTVTASKQVSHPNIPYLMRPKATGTLELSTTNTVVTATPATDGYVDCMSASTYFKISGIYQKKTVNGEYYMNTSGTFSLSTRNITLNPFRFYMKAELRNGSGSMPTAPSYAKVRCMVDGVLDGEVTAITPIDNDVISDNSYYDLSGRRIEKPSNGIYIHKGKKVIIK